MRYLVLVVSSMLLVAPVRTAASTAVAEWSGDRAMFHDGTQQAVRERARARALEERQEARPRRERPEADVTVRTADPQPASPPAAMIAEDGAVETPMPDGSIRRARPGDCGWTIVHPDGRRNTVACIHVPKANLPVPDDASAVWLAGHGDSLLAIARTLLGGNAASLGNYLKTVESENPDVYERIRLRTDLITKLTGQ